jgi:hypothetical protein
MDKLSSLTDTIKKSIGQIMKNDLLGFLVKTRIVALLIGSLFMIPVLIPVFSMMGKVSSFEDSIESTSYTNRVSPQGIDIDFDSESMGDYGRPTSALAPKPTPDPSDMMPGAFEMVMLLVGGLALAIYGIATLNLHTMVSIKIAEGTAEPIKPLLVFSFKRAGPMFLHMVVKGFILLFGYLLFIIPGIYFTVKFMFSEMALLNENLGPIAALKRSAELTKGYKLNLYIKMLGLFCINLLLLIPLVLFVIVLGNKSMGPVFLEMYGTVNGLIFVFFYLELAKMKGNAATQLNNTPEPMPAPTTNVIAEPMGMPSEAPTVTEPTPLQQ